MPSTRLSPDKWIAAGLTALADRGPQALAAEPLARELGTTKGSFYWHFKDLPAYHSALIDTWRQTALERLAGHVGQSGSADQRLRQFGQEILADKQEAALRIWGQSDRAVATMLKKVDAERLTYLTLLLRELGLGNADFARAMQACLAGLPALPGEARKDRLAVYDTLVDTVLAL